MNFKWKQICERGQYETGFIDIYELPTANKAIAIINYLPQFEHKMQRVLFTLILEGYKKDWTEGLVNQIFEDAENCIKNSEFFKFNNLNKLEYMDTQIFSVKNIESFEYLKHGDYTFLKE